MPSRRSAFRLSLLLLALAGLLRFGPGLSFREEPVRPAAPGPAAPRLANEDDTGIDAAPVSPPAEQARLKAARRALALQAAAGLPRPPADTVFSLADGSDAPRDHAIALDELYFPARPAAERLQTLAPAPDLAAHLARAAAFVPVASAPASPAELRHSPAPRLVLYPVGAPHTAANRRIVTPGLAVTLASAGAPTPAPLPHLGIVAWERPAYAPAEAVARIAGDPAQPLRALAALAAYPSLRGARLLLAQEHLPAAVPPAGLFPKQWHLRNTGQNGATKGIDLRAVPAWDLATGEGVTIGIVDGAFDRYHPALWASLDSTLVHDWVDGNEAPWNDEAESSENHATAVAGLALAPGFAPPGSAVPASRVAGAAPRARLAVLRILGGATTEEDDAEAMTWHADEIAVKNNSWGPYPFTDRLYDLPPLFRAALATATSEGREGLGTVFAWSAGNGREEEFQGPKNAYAANRHVIAVGAIDRTGAPAAFSDGGPHLLVSAPGNGKGDGVVALTTTDRRALKGYNGKYITGSDYPDQDYTNSFRGTSASAPLVAGVAALLLELRPDLGWRDVQEILMRTATDLRPSDKAWNRRPAELPGFGLKHHPFLGAGLVNAQKALQLAQDWTPLPAEQLVTGTLPGLSGDYGYTLPDGSRDAVDYAFQLDSTRNLRVEHVELVLDIRHPYRGDLTLQLVSPAGVVSEFVTRTYRDDSADYPGYTFASVRHWGEPSIGAPGKDGASAARWRLRVKDDIPGDQGRLVSATLRLYGTPLTVPAITVQPENVVVGQNSALVLGFQATGSDVVYSWYRNNKLVRQTLGPVYAVAKPGKADYGDYYCIAKNALGTASTRTVTVGPGDLSRRAVNYAGIPLDLTLPNPFPFPARWSATSLPGGLALAPSTGRLTGIRQDYPDAPTVILARSGDRVVRIPLDLPTNPVPASLGRWYVGFAETPADPASGKAGVALRVTYSTYVGQGYLAVSGFDDASARVEQSLPASTLVTHGDGIISYAASAGDLSSAFALPAGDPITFQTTLILAGRVCPVTFHRQKFARQDRPELDAYAGLHVFALVPVPSGQTLPPGLGVGSASVSLGFSTLTLQAADDSPLLRIDDSVTDDGYFIFDAASSTPTRRSRLFGWLRLPAAGGPSSDLDGACWWTREATAADHPANLPYTFNRQALDILGGRVALPLPSDPTLGLAPGAPGLRLALTQPTFSPGNQFDFLAALDLPLGAANNYYYSGPAPRYFQLSLQGGLFIGSLHVVLPPENTDTRVEFATACVPGLANFPGSFHRVPRLNPAPPDPTETYTTDEFGSATLLPAPLH